jgi:hypothetical protein
LLRFLSPITAFPSCSMPYKIRIGGSTVLLNSSGKILAH